VKVHARQATVYADVLRATRWVVENIDAASPIGGRIHARALSLLEDVACAQTFASGEAHLREADEALVRLRALLRVGLDTGVVGEPGFLHLSRELDGVGRQLGGWLRWLAERPAAG
jgi:hypothetical protein